MGNLHLCLDANFIDTTINNFEHFFPGQNVFVILHCNKEITDDNIVKSIGDNIIRLSGDKQEISEELVKICSTYCFDNLLVHSLSPLITPYLPVVRPLVKEKAYWIFWGFDLYWALAEEGKYKLTEREFIFSKNTWITPTKYRGFAKRLLRRPTYNDNLLKAIPYVDYFCFWFKFDYDLLMANYNCNIKYKYFEYSPKYRPLDLEEYSPHKIHNTIIVNHQASPSGNHLMLFDKLRKINGINDFIIDVPVSYGSPLIRNQIIKAGRKYFGDKLVTIEKYMPYDDYMNFICSHQCAIFGQLRQEAAGNISVLLRNGVKVFMREKNPYYKYLKNLGYWVFSIEEDLISVNDICELSEQQKQHNKDVFMNNIVYADDFMPALFND